MKNSKYLINIFLLLIIFGLSVFVRKENLDKPLGWISAHTLVTLSIWEKEGSRHYHCSPVYTFPNAGDKDIPVLGGVQDKENNCYYVSYPPFAFLLPHFIFKAFGVHASPLALRVFGLAVHFFSALFIFLIVSAIAGKSMHAHLFLPAYAGFALYTFAQGNLWFHCSLYFCDMLVQVFFLAGIYFFIRIRNEGITRKLLLCLGFSLFFAVYTEWLGVFLCFSLFLISLIRMIRFKAIQSKLLLTIALPAVIALGLTFWQYSSISGTKAFLQSATQKYLMRSGMDGKDGSEYGFSMNNPASYEYLGDHYDKHYFPIINLILWVLIFYAALCIYRKKYFLTRPQLGLLLLISLPLLLHNLVFFNFNVVHDFSVLKTSALMAVGLALIFSRFLLFFEAWKTVFARPGILLLSALFILKLYECVDHYRFKYNGDFSGSEHEQFGALIKQTAKPAATLFTNGVIVPELFFYAQRNQMPVSGITEARKKLAELKRNEGSFYERKGEQTTALIALDTNGLVKYLPIPGK